MVAIREKRPDDLPHLYSVWREAVEATHDFLSPGDLEPISDMVRDDYLVTADLLVAVDAADRPLGFLGGTGREIDAMFVDPKVHDRGVGIALLDRFAEGGEGSLFVEVNEQNEASVEFYRNRGFEVVERLPHDRQGRPYPLLRMKRG